MIQTLFEQFLDEKRFVSNIAPTTIRFYKFAFKAFALSELPTKDNLNAAIVRMRKAGNSPSGVNANIRGVNAFLSWLHENGHLQEKLKLNKLKCVEREMRTFSDAQIHSLLSFKPKTKSETRLITILHVLTDTGCRINEALSLRRKDIDFENLLLDVKGKGSKIRRIPFSVECRKVLFKHLRSHQHELVFCNGYGGKLLYADVRRSFVSVLAQLRIQTEPRNAFHAFRRFFATHAIRNNVNPFLVQRQLGHSSLTMTNRYLKLETSDLSENHVSALQQQGGAR